jgi:DNA gyrase subunit A
MAEQLNLLGSDRIVPIALHQEMQRSYLEYAMSVIVGRALPDVRDGLKPVQRRILFAMHELGLTPDRPYRKCARVVGDVLGKYHPHGDQSVYEALVRMVQDFSCRYPLLAGHGNFGSIDNDPPAAMRYTETRLAGIGNEAMLGEIGDETVDFSPNFDNSQQEPVVLPAQLPFLLLNGCSGIAVGMATNIPPHNLGEVVDGLVALVDKPTLTDEELFALIPGPDFPTGGEIIGTSGIWDAYRTGRGSITMRGVAQVEEVQPAKGRHRRPVIIISELPYQVNKAGWIEKVAELVNDGKIEGIADIRDESDRDGTRVVIDLKREANPTVVLGVLYQKTALQQNFGAILLAIVGGQPRQFTLRGLLDQFLAFREETLTKRFSHELGKAEDRLEIVDGLLVALDDLDRLIDILRNAPDGSTAKVQLQVQLELSDRQADAILAMPMRRLTGTETASLEREQEELTAQIDGLEKVLGDRRELLKVLKKDLRAFKKRYDTPRRTRIKTTEAAAQAIQVMTETLTDNGPVTDPTVLEMSQKGYVRRLTVKSFQRLEAPELNTEFQEVEDFPVQAERVNPGQVVTSFTRSGKVYSFNVDELSVSRANHRGTPIVTLLPEDLHGDPESLVAQVVMPENLEGADVVLVMRSGYLKRLPLDELTNLTKRGLMVTKLKDGDELQQVVLAKPGQQLVLAASGGRLIRFAITDQMLPYSNRNNQGVVGMRLRSTDRVVGCVAVGLKDSLLLVSQRGYAKRLPVSLLSQNSRGDLGNLGFQFALKQDSLAALVAAPESAMATVLTSSGSVARILVGEVEVYGRDSGGDRLFQPKREERIISVMV